MKNNSRQTNIMQYKNITLQQNKCLPEDNRRAFLSSLSRPLSQISNCQKAWPTRCYTHQKTSSQYHSPHPNRWHLHCLSFLSLWVCPLHIALKHQNKIASERQYSIPILLTTTLYIPTIIVPLDRSRNILDIYMYKEHNRYIQCLYILLKTKLSLTLKKNNLFESSSISRDFIAFCRSNSSHCSCKSVIPFSLRLAY